MADKSVMKKLAVSACVVCCGLNLAFVFAAGTLLTSFAVLSQPHVALITIGCADWRGFFPNLETWSQGCMLRSGEILITP